MKNKQPSQLQGSELEKLVSAIRGELVADGVKDAELYILLRALRKELLMEKVRLLCQEANPNWVEVLVRSDLGASTRTIKDKHDSRLHAPKKLDPDLYPDD
jgi:ribosomal protein L29